MTAQKASAYGATSLPSSASLSDSTGTRTVARSAGRKNELYALVAELHAYRYSQKQIAAALGMSQQRICQVVADIRIKPPAFDKLPYLLRERITDFIFTTRSQAGNEIAA